MNNKVSQNWDLRKFNLGNQKKANEISKIKQSLKI